VIRWMAWAVAAFFKPKSLLVAENLCLRQQLLVLRRNPRVGRKIMIRAIMRLDRSGVSGIAYLTTSINPMIATTFSPRLSASGQSIDSKPRMPPIENSRVPVHLRHARPVTID
jgi:hypothetical protein